MFTIARSITAAGFGLLLAASAAMPASAFTMPAPPAPQPVQSDIIQVRDHGHGHGHWHHHSRWGSGHRLHGDDSYYDDDSDSGVLFKSFVTGTLFNRQRSQGYYDSHARDCASRYRSYRASDNTYQPNHGPRQICR